jgi:hypothetical protein
VHVVKDAKVRTDVRGKQDGRSLKTSLPVQKHDPIPYFVEIHRFACLKCIYMVLKRYSLPQIKYTGFSCSDEFIKSVVSKFYIIAPPKLRRGFIVSPLTLVRVLRRAFPILQF